MNKPKKIKLFIGLFYVSAVSLFLYFFFLNFSLQEITSYEFIKGNRDFFFELRQSNLFLLALLFITFSIIWVLAAGFGFPIALVAGFIFGKWLGLIIVILGMAIGATGLYVFANYFLKEIIKEKFLDKFISLEKKFKKSEFIYLLAFRFVGGIPFALSNVLPCIFNVKISNFFFATLLGMVPQLFLIVSVGSGVEKMIDKNLEAPTLMDLVTSQDIYIPIIGFIILLIITFFVRNLFYKK
jgi:uncharacterized membrane protein YdjX (TVP38/TMEM64 family)